MTNRRLRQNEIRQGVRQKTAAGSVQDDNDRVSMLESKLRQMESMLNKIYSDVSKKKRKGKKMQKLIATETTIRSVTEKPGKQRKVTAPIYINLLRGIGRK